LSSETRNAALLAAARAGAWGAAVKTFAEAALVVVRAKMATAKAASDVRMLLFIARYLTGWWSRERT